MTREKVEKIIDEKNKMYFGSIMSYSTYSFQDIIWGILDYLEVRPRLKPEICELVKIKKTK